MEEHLRAIRTAIMDTDRLRRPLQDQAHADLVRVLCEAMAAQVPPADAAAAANMSLSELFNTLRKNSGGMVPLRRGSTPPSAGTRTPTQRKQP